MASEKLFLPMTADKNRGQGNVVAFFLALLVAIAVYFLGWLQTGNIQLAIWIVGGLLAVYILVTLKIVNQWQKAVVLWLGKYHKIVCQLTSRRFYFGG